MYGSKLERVVGALACKWKPSLLIVDSPPFAMAGEDAFILEVVEPSISYLYSLSSVFSKVKCIFYNAFRRYLSMSRRFPPIARGYAVKARWAAMSRLVFRELKVLTTIAFSCGVDRLILVAPVKCTYIRGRWRPLPYFHHVVAKLSNAIFWVRENRLCQLKPKLLAFSCEGACLPDSSEKLAFEILRI
ncbi:MAG: hypothetical protein DRJ18_03455 [Candidatus Methanomethylicota archaeon]|nr:MAG: hypothetical protein DRJ18_03455 [Candidatus Verstraetearchaeota archaeon]